MYGNSMFGMSSSLSPKMAQIEAAAIMITIAKVTSLLRRANLVRCHMRFPPHPQDISLDLEYV